MAVLFAIGSICFAVGGVEAQWSLTSASVTGVTFFVGSIFFTSAAYLQYSETVNVDHAVGERKHRWRPASWEPGRIDWLASLIQLIGTVLFNISTFAAMNTNLTTHQINARVWGPDAFGSIAFLVSSELAYAEVCHRWVCFRNRTLSWKVVALNPARVDLLRYLGGRLAGRAGDRASGQRGDLERRDVARRRVLPRRCPAADAGVGARGAHGAIRAGRRGPAGAHPVMRQPAPAPS